MNKRAEKRLTDVFTYLGILFLFFLLMYGIISLGTELNDSELTNLDNDSKLYITELASGNRIGEVAKRYNVTEKEVENTILSNRNRSGGTPKDYAIEFLFVTEKGYSVENMIKEVYSIPSTILFLFRLPVQNWKWIIDIIGWMLFFTIILALINYVRRGTK